jgi:hypothetical protein
LSKLVKQSQTQKRPPMRNHLQVPSNKKNLFWEVKYESNSQ